MSNLGSIVWYLLYVALGIGVARGLDVPPNTWADFQTTLFWPAYVAEPITRQYLAPYQPLRTAP